MLRIPMLTLLAALVIFAPLAGQSAVDRDVERILNEPSVRRALSHVEDSDAQTIRDLITLTEIPAPPFMETERGRAFSGMLRDTGVDSVWTDAVGNVIGLRRGLRSGTGAVAIAGHLDTVFPEGTDVAVRMSGDTIYAPGVGDDTRGLAAVLAILRAMNEAGVQTDRDVLFIGDVGEEGLGDLRGMKHLFRDDGPNIHSFISVDGISDTSVTHKGLGSHRYHVRFKGPGGHSWGAFGLANPANALGRAVHYFDLEADQFTSTGPKTSYNVGVLEGGTSINSIPFEAGMWVDMRSESRESLAQVDEIFQAAMRRGLAEVNEARRTGPPLTLEVEMVGDRPSGEVSENDPIVQRAVAATRLFGLEPSLGRSSTDSNIPISLGIPAITIGGGGVGGNAHSPDEWFLNENGARGIQRALVVLVAQAGLGPIS